MFLLRQTGFALLALFFAPGGFAAFADDAPPPMQESFLTPPKAAEIVALANDVKLPPDFKGVAITVDKAKVMEFFTNGEAHPADRDRAKWRTLAGFTLPDDIAANPILTAARQESAQMPNGVVYLSAFIHARGVVATDGGAIYFWRLWNERVLELEDDAGRSCLLVLGVDAAPFATAVRPYGQFDGAAPEKKLYGKMPVPPVKDIVAISNRPEGEFGEGRRSYLEPERMRTFLAALVPNQRNNGLLLLARFDGCMNPFTSPVNANYMYNGGDPGLLLRAEGACREDEICDGALATRDKRIIFWRMGADGVFYFMDEQHRTNFAFSAAGAELAQSLYVVCRQFDMDGRKQSSILARGNIFNGDAWQPFHPPPLDKAGAVRSAWARLEGAAGGKEAGSWRVARVAATRFANGSRWYYTVCFTNVHTPGVETPVLVSMDGTAGDLCEAGTGAQKIQEAANAYNQQQATRFNGGRFWNRIIPMD